MHPIRYTELEPRVGRGELLETLEQVIDPELGIDIVNLGLVYEVRVTGEDIYVGMTLTTPGCPLHGSITRDVRVRLERLEGAGWVEVELLWSPPWSPERMSDEARQQLSWR